MGIALSLTRSQRVRLVVGIFLLLTFAGVVESLQLLVPGGRMAQYGHGPDLGGALAHTVPSWWLLGALVPAAAWLALRRPLVGAGVRNLVLHVAVSLLFPLLHIGLVAFLYGVILDEVRPSAAFLDMISVYYVYDLFLYWLVVGGAHLLRYHRELKNREIRELQLRSDLSETRLQALRSQLDPHFLFNSLNTVVGMALERGHEEVADAITELSELLRTSLREDGHGLVPLERELAFVHRYLRLQKHRFGDRLTFGTEIEPDAGGAMVPVMILQPLVENAVVHGPLPDGGQVQIEVVGRRRDGLLELEVRDDGPGIPPDPPARDGGGVGLANTRSRLRTLFGERGDLETGTGPDGGGTARIRIPWIPAPGRRSAATGVLV